MRVLFIAVLLAGCASAQPAATTPAPARTLLASITITESAFKGPIRRKTGFEFHVVDSPPGAGGPVLEGQEFRDGKLVDSFDFGSSSTEIAAIEKVGLTPFDFDREVADATGRAQRQAQERGEVFLHGTRDGAQWEIVIVTKAGMFNLRAWNPVAEVDSLAPYSENLAKLKAVIDLLVHNYGRYRMGF